MFRVYKKPEMFRNHFVKISSEESYNFKKIFYFRIITPLPASALQKVVELLNTTS